MNREIVYIEWCDAMSNMESWTGEKEALEWAETENWINKQVGFVVKETDKYLLLCGEIGNIEGSEVQLGQLIKIPTTWILNRQTLKQTT